MDVIKPDKEKHLKQSNRLIEAKYKLTVYEQRMMIFICSQLNQNATNFDSIRVSVADIARFCKFEQQKGYTLVKSTIMRLMTRIVQIKTEDGGWYATHWLQSARYVPSESVIEYKIDERLRPELLQLKAAYLSTPAAPLMEFRRDYSARLYFLLKKMLKVCEFEYELDFFRARFQLSKSYDIFFNLKNKVLEPALAEINDKSDISVMYEYIKQGRNYTKIKFTVTSKENKALPATSVPLEKELESRGQTRLFDMAADENDIAYRLAKYDISKKKSEELVKHYGEERVDRNLKYAYQNRQGKQSMSGWIIDCIKNDYAAISLETGKLAMTGENAMNEKIMAQLEPMEKDTSYEIPPNSPFKKYEKKINSISKNAKTTK